MTSPDCSRPERSGTSSSQSLSPSPSANSDLTPQASNAPSGNRLLVWFSAILVAGWFLFLLYLVLTSANPVVVSRPQVLVAPIVVVGVLTDKPSVVVQEVLEGEPSLAGKELPLAEFRFTKGTPPNETYIIPLTPAGKGKYLVQPIPLEAGVDPKRKDFRVYPPTDSARRQVKELLTVRRQQK